MRLAYHLADRGDNRTLSEFPSKDGLLLLPQSRVIEQAELALDELIDVTGRSTIEAMLTLSAHRVAGDSHPGKGHGDTRWNGRRSGIVPRSDRILGVSRPRPPASPRGSLGKTNVIESPKGMIRPDAGGVYTGSPTPKSCSSRPLPRRFIPLAPPTAGTGESFAPGDRSPSDTRHEKVNQELERRILKAWWAIHTRSVNEKIPLRIAAYCDALVKVAEATRQRF